MSEKPQNLYEGMYVLKATLSDEARNKALDKIKMGIASRHGEVVKIHDQGRRRLAYEINGLREGYYSAINEIWQEYHLNEDLIRFITLRTEAVMEKIEFKVLEEQQ
jgi:small subunit ribosomal protein S6